MTLQTWVKSEVGYGEELVRSAITGGRSARDHALGSEPAEQVLQRSARSSVPWVTMAASVGALAAYVGARRRSVPAAAMLGVLLGAVVGFGTTMAWSTRHVTEETVRGAVKSVNAARDAHWLANNPIDYA
jgi:hypothetical protein